MWIKIGKKKMQKHIHTVHAVITNYSIVTQLKKEMVCYSKLLLFLFSTREKKSRTRNGENAAFIWHIHIISGSHKYSYEKKKKKTHTEYRYKLGSYSVGFSLFGTNGWSSVASPVKEKWNQFSYFFRQFCWYVNVSLLFYCIIFYPNGLPVD